jgi:hypothetical protein
MEEYRVVEVDEQIGLDYEGSFSYFCLHLLRHVSLHQ